MPTYTTNLNLPEYHPTTEGDTYFSVENMLNDPYDKIDAFAGTTTTGISALDVRTTAVEGTTSTHTEQITSLTNRATAVEGRATALETFKTAAEAQLNGLVLKHGSYTGNGSTTSNKTITFGTSADPCYPVWVYVVRDGSIDLGCYGHFSVAYGQPGYQTIYVQNGGGGDGGSGGSVSGWGTQALTFGYWQEGGTGSHPHSWNETNTTYRWVALGHKTAP